jgi:hypothetical protein
MPCSFFRFLQSRSVQAARYYFIIPFFPHIARGGRKTISFRRPLQQRKQLVPDAVHARVGKAGRRLRPARTACGQPRVRTRPHGLSAIVLNLVAFIAANNVKKQAKK